MNASLFRNSVVVLLLISFIVPVAFFALPPRVSADNAPATCAGGLITGLAAAKIWGKIAVPSGDLANTTATWSTYGTTLGNCIYTYIIVPAARALIRQWLQQMTQDTINWINGQGSPGGQKSFVPNLSVHLQGVGDSVATSFFAQIVGGFQSPFGNTIAASLRQQYLQQTSLAGFFSQYRSTLAQSSPNINAFLGGNWTQGGVQSWLALTTQPQNNPYLLYQAASNQLAVNVNAAQANRRQDLLQSGGFLSFCPGNTTSADGACFANADGSCPVGCKPDDTASTGCEGTSIQPQPACMNPDGTPANATTPGSVISSFLQANVNSGVGQLVSAQDLDGALQQIVTALASRVLNSSGLFSSSNSGSNRGGSTGGSTGGTNSGTSQAAQTAQSTLSDLTAYSTAGNTIKAAATAAQSNLSVLSHSCGPELAAGMIGGTPITSADVQNALATEITPVLNDMQTALASVPAKQTFAQKVLDEANGTADPTQLGTDLITLASMPPSSVDLTDAQQNAQTTGTAAATPFGSLTVSGGTTVDQMNLLAGNALSLAKQCAGYTNTGGGTAINAGALLANTGRYFDSSANQAVCFSVTIGSQNLGRTDQWFGWTTFNQPYAGGNITLWLSSTLGGSDMGGTLKTEPFTAGGGDLSAINHTFTSTGQYYYCLKPDTTGNRVGVSWSVPPDVGSGG